MGADQGLSQELKTGIRIVPAQVQLVRFIEMNDNEVNEAIERELIENTALEKVETSPDDPDFDNPNEENADEEKDDYGSRDDIFEHSDGDSSDDDYIERIYNGINRSADDTYYSPTAVAESSMTDDLMSQMSEFELNSNQELIAQYIIGNLDDDGYLRISPQEIADNITYYGGIEVEGSEVEEVLNLVRKLDPPGIGARDLRDCILLQLERKPNTPITNLARDIISNHFEEYEKKHYDKICSALGIDRDTLQEVDTMIREDVNPKPGNAFPATGTETHLQQITPDFTIDNDNNRLTLSLPNRIPELQIAESYVVEYEKNKGRRGPNKLTGDSLRIKQEVDKATSFIDLLKQRQNTLYKTMRAIMMRQSNFFLTGDESELKPMILKDIAADTDLDVSTISRATSNKYVATPFGTYPLKFFFTEGLMHDDGNEVSSREILKKLQEIIDAEDKHRPLSDEKLCEMLNKCGYQIARRTVAKYRESISIPVARLRKTI